MTEQEIKTGAELIAEERKRQIEVEGYDSVQDLTYQYNELVEAAICYATPENERKIMHHYKTSSCPYSWPWPSQFWKPTPNDRVRELVKAGALIAAEIDRLQNQSK